MAKLHFLRELHVCACECCQRHPRGAVAREHRRINRLLATADERLRRLLAGFLAQQQGRGGISLLARVTGLDRNTIARGLRELRRSSLRPSRRLRPRRRPPPCGKKSPRLKKVLDELLRDATAGDPVSGLKWTHRSLRKVQRALRRRGLPLAIATIARLLRQSHFALRTNRKRVAGIADPDRDRQFRYLTRLRRLYVRRGLPAVSVDTKKKELIGNFKNPGRSWRQGPREVLDHDFPTWALGRAIPVGVYDLRERDGYVLVGCSHDTPAFTVAAIRRWWQEVGRRRYPGARRLLICADGGGATDHRKWGLEGGAAEVGRCIRADRDGNALPGRRLEVEPGRAPPVQRHQRQLGGRAAGEL